MALLFVLHAENGLVIFRKRVPGLSEVALAKFLRRACRAARLRGAVNVVVTGSRELRALNNRFRGRGQTHRCAIVSSGAWAVT